MIAQPAVSAANRFGREPHGPGGLGTFRWVTGSVAAATIGMMSPLGPSPRPRVVRLLMLLLAVALATGVASTVVSASSLPSCRVADVATAKRSYNDWQQTLLDTTY